MTQVFDYLLEYLQGLPPALAILAMAVALVALVWLIRNATTPQDDHAVLRAGNVAVAIERGGFVIAHVVAMGFAIWAFDREAVWASVALVGIKCAITSTVLLALVPLVDWAVLPRIPNNDLVLDGNSAVATVMACVYVALGVVMGAATVGSGPSLVVSLVSTAVFGVAGIAVVLGVTRLHLAVTHRGEDTRGALRAGKFAPALELGSIVLGLGIIMSVGVAGDLHTWVEGFRAFAATCLIGLAVLYASQWLVNRLMTRGASGTQVRREGNVALVAVVSCGRLGLALLIAGVLARVV